MNLCVWNWWKSQMSRNMPFIVYGRSFFFLCLSHSFSIAVSFVSHVFSSKSSYIFFLYLFLSSFANLCTSFFCKIFRMPNSKWLECIENAGVRYLIHGIFYRPEENGLTKRSYEKSEQQHKFPNGIPCVSVIAHPVGLGAVSYWQFALLICPFRRTCK